MRAFVILWYSYNHNTCFGFFIRNCDKRQEKKRKEKLLKLRLL